MLEAGAGWLRGLTGGEARRVGVVWCQLMSWNSGGGEPGELGDGEEGADDRGLGLSELYSQAKPGEEKRNSGSAGWVGGLGAIRELSGMKRLNEIRKGC